jgi:hypothetical protein
MFCCQGFENLIVMVGQRGLSALVYHTPKGFRFTLQGRAVSKEDELILTQNRSWTPLPIKGNVTLSANIALNSPAKPPALPERIEAVLQLRE